MESSKCIAAISTAPGGGIGIVRVSGRNTYDIVSKVFRSADKTDPTKYIGTSVKYGHIYSPSGELIDECIAIFFHDPHSYTGEDVIELQCHGGTAALTLTLRAVMESGAEMARAGEFTRRAFENGRLSLTQAESVMGMISAQGEEELREMNAAQSGKIATKIGSITAKLTSLCGALSAWADFPEDDIPVIPDEELKERISEIETELSLLSSSSEHRMMLNKGIKTVIIGKPNVGKSSLMNLLAGYDRCIVTDIPGTTRDIIEETISVGKVLLRVLDTAGIRETEDKIEAIGVTEALRKLDEARLVLAVFDGSEKLSKYDVELLERLRNRTVIGIINKTDKQQMIDEKYIREKIKQIVYISAVTGEGAELLKETIEQTICSETSGSTEVVLINERQLSLCRKALSEIRRAAEDLKRGMTFDAVTISLEAATASLLELTGERVSDKIVDEIFASFCIGK